jgi:hypothetical protein
VIGVARNSDTVLIDWGAWRAMEKTPIRRAHLKEEAIASPPIVVSRALPFQRPHLAPADALSRLTVPAKWAGRVALTVMTIETPQIMKVMTAPLFPDPSPARGGL